MNIMARIKEIAEELSYPVELVSELRLVDVEVLREFRRTRMRAAVRSGALQ